MKTRIIILLLSIFMANTFFCLAQEATKRLISENDFEKITLLEKVTIEKLKARNQSWTLLKENLGPPENEEDKDDFVEQTKVIAYNGAKFLYSDAGDPGNFTLTHISITEPGFNIIIQDKHLQVGDSIEKAAYFSHSKNESDSTLSIRIYVTDAAGDFRLNDLGERMTSEYKYLSVKFDPSTGKITEINFKWRII